MTEEDPSQQPVPRPCQKRNKKLFVLFGIKNQDLSNTEEKHPVLPHRCTLVEVMKMMPMFCAELG